MHGLSSISASWSRSKLKTKNTKPINGGSLTYKQWYAPTATHLTLGRPIFSPPYISPKPLFLQKIVTQSPIFATLSRILEIFHSKTPNELEFKKKIPKCRLFFMAFVTERPPIFLPCIHMFVWGECCSLKHGQKLENFVFSKQNRAKKSPKISRHILNFNWILFIYLHRQWAPSLVSSVRWLGGL